jgi:hypothetical protein
VKTYFHYIAIITASLALSGCTTFEDIDNGLSNLHGQHIDALVAKIGYPLSQNEVAGRKLYIWDSRKTFSYSLPVTTYNSGNVNTYGAYGNTYGTYSGSTTSYVPQVTTYYCTITVEVNAYETIVAAQYNGNIGGCEPYAKAFREE